MKTWKYLFCLLFAGVSLSLAGCGDDNDDDGGKDPEVPPTEVTVGWKEAGNKLILTTKYNVGGLWELTEVLTFTFGGTNDTATCTGATAAITYPNSVPTAALNAAVAALREEYPSASLSGRTITIPLPQNEWQGMTRSQIREAFRNYEGIMNGGGE